MRGQPSSIATLKKNKIEIFLNLTPPSNRTTFVPCPPTTRQAGMVTVKKKQKNLTIVSKKIYLCGLKNKYMNFNNIPDKYRKISFSKRDKWEKI
jgi:hypothetical protein